MKKIRSILCFAWPYVTILCLITLMLSYQISNHATLITSDAWIHFYRFYDTSIQIKSGNFSYFQSNFSFYHSGRIFNAMYGPFFAYLNGLLLLICKSWFIYQIIIDYLVLLIDGIGMYLLCRKVDINEIFSILLAGIYLQIGIAISILRFNWMAWGAALAPFVIMHAVNMLDSKKSPIHWIGLALIMSILAQIHMLSTLILAVTLIPFFGYAFFTTSEKKKLILALLKAILLTLLLTANIWGAFLLLYFNNNIALPNVFNLQHYSLHLSKFASLHAHVSYTIFALIILRP